MSKGGIEGAATVFGYPRPELASYLRIEDRELEAGGLN
jgi:hypothetical protein